MKRTTLHAYTIVMTAAVLAAAGFVLSLSSCDAAPIFASIEEEVALADPSIRGNVTSMVFVGDTDGTKYAANGAVYRKVGVDGSWDKLGLPAAAHRCAQLAWDGNALFGLMQDENYKPAGVYYYAADDWQPITGTEDMVRIYDGNGFVFGFTHAGDEDGGTYGMYQITSLGAVTEPSAGTEFAMPTSSAVTADGSSYFATLDGVYDGTGTMLPTTGLSAIPSGILAMTASDVTTGAFFAANTSTLYVYDVATSTWQESVTHEGTQTGSTCIAWLRMDTSSGVVLVAGGDTDGYSEVTVTGAVGETPVLGSSHSVGSGVSSIPDADVTQYDSTLGQWTLLSIFADTSAASTGSNDYVLYAGVVNEYGYDGLWAYYPATRSEWNRE